MTVASRLLYSLKLSANGKPCSLLACLVESNHRFAAKFSKNHRNVVRANWPPGIQNIVYLVCRTFISVFIISFRIHVRTHSSLEG